ncbi:MAG: fused MFS/spermidine synthase [Acidobacteria bacterium]|nr:fused MFS/spermidine synthase [Acidobacteriota bacterium]
MIFPLALVVFFASGFAALLYQVIWQRILAIFSGADVYSATVIVAAFMGGLGVGHIAGGHVADRVTRRTSLLLFGGAELAIAVFGLFSGALYYDVLYERLGAVGLGRGTIAGILFGSLLWPTFFMGASLPLLSRALTDRIDRAASAVGALYGCNTLGAAAGAIVATWALLPALGLEGSLRVGATLNAACAAALLPLAWRMVGSDPGDEAYRPLESGHHWGQTPVTPPHGGLTPFLFWAVIYGFAGFLALSYEIVWFRLLGIVVKSTAFTFGTLLALYLAGIGLGALVGSARAPRARRPARAFFLLQAAAGLSAGLLLALFIVVADDARALRGYFAGYEPLSVRDSVHALRTLVLNVLPGPDVETGVPANFLRLYVLVPLLLVVPPTFLMGCAFPYLQRVVQTDVSRIGRRVGGVLLANIVGSMLGTAVTGWLFLGVLGTAATLKLLAALSSVFLLFALVSPRHEGDELELRAAGASGSPRRLAWSGGSSARALVLAIGLAAAASVSIVAMMPNGAELWARLHGTTVDRIVFAEDNSGLALIKAEHDDLSGPKIVFANGVGQSVIPYGDIHTALGALPALVHADPREIAIIGLGSGDTVYAAASRAETVHVTCVEIIRPQLGTLQELARRDAYGGLRALLADPRVEHVFGDGRAYLMRTTRRFDIIEADALRPTSAYSGNLYSDEYFTLVRDRLKPNGVAATWAPTARVHDTFIRVFPYVISMPGILLGSNEPFAIDRAAVAARMADPRVREHYARAGVDLDALLGPYLDGESARFGPDFDRGTLVDLNTDLFPKDEYDLSPP